VVEHLTRGSEPLIAIRGVSEFWLHGNRAVAKFLDRRTEPLASLDDESGESLYNRLVWERIE